VGDVAAKLGVDQEPAQLLGVLGRESKTLKAPGKAASQVINPHQPRALGLVVGQQTSRLAADIVSEEPIEPRGLAPSGVCCRFRAGRQERRVGCCYPLQEEEGHPVCDALVAVDVASFGSSSEATQGWMRSVDVTVARRATERAEQLT
jgi:hypothetical protein